MNAARADVERLYGLTETYRLLDIRWESFCGAIKAGDLKTTDVFRGQRITESDLRAYLIAEAMCPRWSLPKHRRLVRGGCRTKRPGRGTGAE